MIEGCTMIDDLKVIKKLYGEKMSHLCRELFPTILEEPCKLSTLLQEKFEPSKILYEDLILNLETLILLIL